MCAVVAMPSTIAMDTLIKKGGISYEVIWVWVAPISMLPQTFMPSAPRTKILHH